jgi:F420-dependent oxidoreductase-like protein
VKLVVHLSRFEWPRAVDPLRDLLTDVAVVAEEGGFDGFAVADHLWQHPMMGGVEQPSLEAYTTLGYLAARTQSLRLFTLATGAHFRHPAVLAKIVTTLDVLSGGRAWLGIGAGHHQEECDGLGVPFPSLHDRYELLEDALDVCTRMWSGEHGTDTAFTGHHVDAARLLNSPQSVQRPRPPILIAGDGEQRTLALVARYADACSLRPYADIRHKLDVLHRHCDDAGTDFDRIERTCASAFAPDDGGPATRDLLEHLETLAGLGIDTVIGRPDGDDPRHTLELLARHVIPVVDELEVRR